MLALFLLLLLGVDWASGYAIAGYCMRHGVSPYGYAFWQSFGPFVLLLLIQIFRHELWLSKSGVRYAILCGVFGIVIPNLIIYLSLQYVSPGMLTVLSNLSPIFTYLLALIFKEEKFKWQRTVLVSTALIGIFLIILPRSAHLELNLNNDWIYIALLIPLSYAFSAVYLSKFHPGSGSVLNYALWMLMVSTLCVGPLTVFYGGYYRLEFANLNTYLILLEVLLSSLGYILLFIIIRMVGSVYYSLVNAITAISGVIYGYFLFDEQFSLLTYTAIGIILFSILIMSFNQRVKNNVKV